MLRASRLAEDIAHHPSEISLELSQLPGCPFELLGMGIALLLDERELAHPGIGLTEDNAVLPGQVNELFSRPVQKLRIRRVGHILRLDRRINHHGGQVRTASSALVFTATARLSCKRAAKLFLPHPLTLERVMEERSKASLC